MYIHTRTTTRKTVNGDNSVTEVIFVALFYDTFQGSSIVNGVFIINNKIVLNFSVNLYKKVYFIIFDYSVYYVYS